jgi:hypothetical protein
MFSPLTAFLCLLAVHWLADFVAQTNWQASNKSKDNLALGAHVAVYTLVLSFGVDFLFVGASWAKWTQFLVLNAILHFWTDWVTSRINSRLFVVQFETTIIPWVMKRDFNLHNFFMSVGFDQLIHQVTLAVTMLYCFY